MKKTSTKEKSFRDYEGFDWGARSITIAYLPLPLIQAKYKDPKAKSGFDWDNSQIDIAEGLDDRATLLCLLHEMRHVAMADQQLYKYIDTSDSEETIMDAMAMFDSEVAYRNPDFWKSLSLRED